MKNSESCHYTLTICIICTYSRFKKTSAYKYAIYAYNVLNCSKVILCSLVSTLSLVTTLPDTWIVMAKGYYFLISLNAWIAISITQQITTLVADL